MTTKAELQQELTMMNETHKTWAAGIQRKIDAMKDDKPVRTGRVISVDELEHDSSVFIIGHSGNIIEHYLLSSDDVEMAVKQGSAFHDRESAEREVKRREIVQRMRVAAKESGEVDWSENHSVKFNIIFDVDDGDLLVASYYSTQTIGSIYFATEKAAQVFLDSLTDEEKEVLKEVV